MRRLLSITFALFVLFAFVSLGASQNIYHDVRNSHVFDYAGDLAVAANDVAVSRFTYDDHCVTRAETLVGEAVFDFAWRRDAGVQNAVYQAIVEEWGSPLQRLGAYGNAGERPAVVDGEIVDALWDLGAASTAYRNLGGKVEPVKTEVVQRWMSWAELENTVETGLIRGGRPGDNFVTDSANGDAFRAVERLALDHIPEVRVELEVPLGVFPDPTRVAPKYGQPGGGMERFTSGIIPANVLRVFK